MRVQAPAESTKVVLPLTVQTAGAVLAKVTGLPDVPPVADRLKVSPTALVTGLAGLKPVMIWVALVMLLSNY